MTSHNWIKIPFNRFERQNINPTHRCSRCGLEVIITQRFDAIRCDIYTKIMHVFLNSELHVDEDCDNMLIAGIHDS